MSDNSRKVFTPSKPKNVINKKSYTKNRIKVFRVVTFYIDITKVITMRTKLFIIKYNIWIILGLQVILSISLNTRVAFCGDEELAEFYWYEKVYYEYMAYLESKCKDLDNEYNNLPPYKDDESTDGNLTVESVESESIVLNQAENLAQVVAEFDVKTANLHSKEEVILAGLDVIAKNYPNLNFDLGVTLINILVNTTIHSKEEDELFTQIINSITTQNLLNQYQIDDPILKVKWFDANWESLMKKLQT